MARGRQIQRFQPFGIQPDIAAVIQPDDVWSLAKDIVFRERGSERVRGLEAVYGDPEFPPVFPVFAQDSNEQPVWLYGADAGIGLYDGAAHSDITPIDFLTPVGQNPWTGGLLNGVPVMCARRPYYWDGAGVMQRLPG